MYTQCPKCLTYFQVTADHLKVAQGNVRCGQCSNIFSALGNLSEIPPKGKSDASSQTAKRQTKPPASSPSPKRPVNKENNAQNKLNSAIAAIQALNQSSQKILSQSRKKYVTQLQRQAQAKRKHTNIDARASAAPDLNLEELDADTMSALANNITETAEPSIDFDQALAAVDEIDIDNELATGTDERPTAYDIGNDADITPPFDATHLVEDYAIDDALEAEDLKIKPSTSTAQKSNRQNTGENEFDFSELNLPPTEASDVTAFKEKANKATQKQPAQPKIKTGKPVKAVTPRVTEAKAEPPVAMVIENNIPTLAIPKQLLEDFQEEHHWHPAHYRAMITWGLGSLMLMFVFLGQTVYFKHNELGQLSQLRPWIAFFCKHASCELTLLADIGQIELLGQDIRSHPSSKQALLVSTTIINNAPFTQPYPGLQLNFSDMNGEKVAMRNFLPKDYLPSSINIAKGMESNIPIQIELEIVDPGKNAVNFEFDFFPI
ncbi:MAG TPA: zinc-ribbon and DUF3426 domain-containing protein [Gammaproteobacteria bacterium]